MWEVPVMPIKTLPPGDSAVTMYWPERWLPAGGARELGFAYGLGNVAGGEGKGELALSVGGSFAPGGEFTVTAYVKRPTAGQVVTLSLPDGFDLAQGSLQQTVPPLDLTAATRISPVTWRVQAPRREGSYTVTVRSSTGVTQTQRVSIKAKTIY